MEGIGIVSIRLAPDVVVTGTLVWYLHVCPREVWFMARNITPFKYHRRLEYGRELHRHHAEEVHLSLEGMRLDGFREDSGVVVEVKSTSRHLESARAQLGLLPL
jgi:CRISPR-associated exonuclease Cas4